MSGGRVDVSNEKIVVLEDGQYADIRQKARDKKMPSGAALAVFDVNASEVINEDRERQYHYVNWYERHVEQTTSAKQKDPAKLVRQQEIGKRHQREKQQKFD